MFEILVRIAFVVASRGVDFWTFKKWFKILHCTIAALLRAMQEASHKLLSKFNLRYCALHNERTASLDGDDTLRA